MVYMYHSFLYTVEPKQNGVTYVEDKMELVNVGRFFFHVPTFTNSILSST